MLEKIRASNTSVDSINLKNITLQFDTRNRKPTESNYSWNVYSSGYNGRRGDLNITGNQLQNIISMRVVSFWLPISTTNYYKKIRMFIKEFGSQSISVSEFLGPNEENYTEPYHFEFNVEKIEGNRAFLVPERNTFLFTTPMTQTDTFTVIFRSPFENTPVETDSGVFVVTYGATTTLVTTSSHKLSTGDVVYLTGISTGVKFLNNALNTFSGLPVTVLSTTQLSVPVDSSAATVPNQVILLCITVVNE